MKSEFEYFSHVVEKQKVVPVDYDDVVRVVGIVTNCDPPMDVTFIVLEVFAMWDVSCIVIVASNKLLFVVFCGWLLCDMFCGLLTFVFVDVGNVLMSKPWGNLAP
jgi:hypothetical protein